jgi:hypothetical protein
MLFLDGRVVRCVAAVRLVWVVVVVGPFGLVRVSLASNGGSYCSYKVIRELETREICIRILKVDDDELFVLVSR